MVISAISFEKCDRQPYRPPECCLKNTSLRAISQEMKVVRLERKRGTVTVCNAILYIETFKDSKKKKNKPKNLATIFLNEFSKVAGYKVNTEMFVAFLYKINTEIFVAFLYTNKELSEKEFF